MNDRIEELEEQLRAAQADATRYRDALIHIASMAGWPGQIDIQNYADRVLMGAKTGKEAWCDTCEAFTPIIEELAKPDEENPFPWADATCERCTGVLLNFRLNTIPREDTATPSS